MLEAFKIKLHTLFMKYRRNKKVDPKKTFINPYSTENPVKTIRQPAIPILQKPEVFDPVNNNPFRDRSASKSAPFDPIRTNPFRKTVPVKPVETVKTVTITKAPSFVQDMEATASEDVLWLAGIMRREKKKNVEEKKITSDQILAACNSLNNKKLVVTTYVEDLFED